MKKIILLLLLVFIFNVPVYSVTPASLQLTNIEKTLFGFNYSNETDTKRLTRIETHLYGASATGDVNKRITKIAGDLGVNPNTAVAKTDDSKIASNTNSAKKESKRTPPASVNEDPSVEYPIIDKIEQKVFNQTYKGENIYSRLDRIETKVYQKTSDEDLSSRVNKLRLSVFDSADAVKERYSYSSDYDKVGKNSYDYNDGYDAENYNYSSTYGGSRTDNLDYKLTAIEDAMFKKTYTNDTTSARLARIETKLFKRDYSNDSESDRVDRIAAAAAAKQSSIMYDNNKLMRNLATGAQVGGFLLMILAMLL